MDRIPCSLLSRVACDTLGWFCHLSAIRWHLLIRFTDHVSMPTTPLNHDSTLSPHKRSFEHFFLWCTANRYLAIPYTFRLSTCMIVRFVLTIRSDYYASVNGLCIPLLFYAVFISFGLWLRYDKSDPADQRERRRLLFAWFCLVSIVLGMGRTFWMG